MLSSVRFDVKQEVCLEFEGGGEKSMPFEELLKCFSGQLVASIAAQKEEIKALINEREEIDAEILELSSDCNLDELDLHQMREQLTFLLNLLSITDLSGSSELFRAALSQLLAGEADEALALLDRDLAGFVRGERARLLALRANALELQLELDQAAEYWEQALALDQGYWILFQVGGFHFRDHAPQEALRYWESALESAETPLQRALVLHKLGYLRTVTLNRVDPDSYREALQIFSEYNSEGDPTLSRMIALAWNNLGAARHAQNDLEEALRCFERAYSIMERLYRAFPEVYFSSLMDTLTNRAFILQELKEEEKAKWDFRRLWDDWADQKDPDLAEARLMGMVMGMTQVARIESRRKPSRDSNYGRVNLEQMAQDIQHLRKSLVWLSPFRHFPEYTAMVAERAALLASTDGLEVAFAKGEFLAARKMYKTLVEFDKKVYGLQAALVFLQEAYFLAQIFPNDDAPIELAGEALRLSLTYPEGTGGAQAVGEKAIDLLKSWGIDPRTVLGG